MVIFVFSTKKPMGIAAYMKSKMKNDVLMGGLRLGGIVRRRRGEQWRRGGV